MLAIGVPPQLHDILLDVSHDGSSLPLVTHIDDLHTSYKGGGLEEAEIRGGVLGKIDHNSDDANRYRTSAMVSTKDNVVDYEDVDVTFCTT